MAKRIADLQNDFLQDELQSDQDKKKEILEDFEEESFVDKGNGETESDITEQASDGTDVANDSADLESDGIDLASDSSDQDEFDENGDYKKKKRVPTFYSFVLLVLILSNVGLLLGLLWQREQVRKEETEVAMLEEQSSVLYTPEEVEEMLQNERAVMEANGDTGKQQVLNDIKNTLESGNNLAALFRSLYKDDIVVYSKGAYHFVPINKSLKMNEYSMDNLETMPSGEYMYFNGEELISHKGIDVSKHQGSIDWQQVAEDGVEFAFLRVGFRGYGKEGKLVLDDTFEDNIKGAKAAGIKVGVYMYTQALNEEELLEEAQLVLDTIAPYRIDCPIVYDVEMVDGNGRMNSLDVKTRTDLTILFCETIKKAGYKPMIYHNMEMGALKLELDRLEEYDKWFAYYNKDMYYPYAYKIWQYSAKGRVKGISGEVDMNIAFDKLWD